MNLLRDVSVAIEHKGSGVRVGAHIVEDEPVANLSALQVSVFLTADLVETITGRPKNSSWNAFSCLLKLFRTFDCRLESHGNGMVVVIDHVVERAIDSIIDVEGLVFAFSALSSINFGCDCCRTAYEITSRFSDVPELARTVCVHSRSEIFNCLSHGSSNLGEGGSVFAVGSLIVSRETATDIDKVHFLHTELISRLKKFGGMIKSDRVSVGITAA